MTCEVVLTINYLLFDVLGEKPVMCNIKIFLEKSEKLRKGYLTSLNNADLNYKEKWLKHFGFLPSFFEEIYSVCNGTGADIAKQVYFDFLPGFRLMQVDEIIGIYEKRIINSLKYNVIIPFLTDYSGCYYAYSVLGDKEFIVFVSKEGIEVIHSDINSFWKTIIAFYDEGVYFLDDDGYLSYDFEREGVIGKQYNAGVAYWD